MYTEQQFIELEQEELALTEEAIAAILLIMATAHGNIERELYDFYRKYGKDGVVTYAEARKWVDDKDRRARMTVLSLFLATEFNSALLKVKHNLETMLKSVIGKETGFFGVEVDVDKLLTLPWGVDASTWLKRLEADGAMWQVRITGDLKRAMLKGETLDDVLLQLNKRFKSIATISEALGLSESTAIGSMARQKIFKELGVTKYQFYTKPDEQRCEQCGAMHGHIFPMSAYEVGFTASPIHPRCRCWEVPIME